MSLEVDIKKKLGKFGLEVSFKSEKSCLGILGASGCGKTMTLKCIAGIVTPDEGRISLNGRVIFDSVERIDVRPQKRKVGYLFQDYALFPTFTAYQNIGSGLNMPKHKKKETVDNLIKRFHLEGIENQYPHELSGGQQQRTALARIIACEPDLILLDEPFSALDCYLREEIQLETSEALNTCENSILVTHDRDEAYKLCPELLVMDSGKVISFGKTKELFQNPGTVQVAKLTGCKNITRVKHIGDYSICALDWGNVILVTGKPVNETIGFAGIRAHELKPVYTNCGCPDNLIRLHIVDQFDMPFGKQIIFRNANVGNISNQADIWWEYTDIHINSEPPEFLRIPPESLLLLKG